MEPLGTQLRRQRRRLGLSLDDLAKLTGISKPYLSLVENSKTKGVPSDSKISVLEQTLKFPRGSLMVRAHLARTPPDVRGVLQDLLNTGRSLATTSAGPATPTTKASADLASPTPYRSLDDAYLSGALQAMVEDRVGNAERARVRQVPLINRVSAGYPTDFTDLDYPARVADEYVPAPDTEGVANGGFAARVCGDSMLPNYRDGDIVVFSPIPDPKDGDDCFIRLEDGRTTFKRTFFEKAPEGGDTVRLQPLNPKYQPKILPAEKVAGIYRATWVTRAL